MSFYVGARIDDEMLEPLNFLSVHLKRSKSFLMGEALKNYIDQQMEEIEEMRELEKDTKMLLARRNNNSKLYSSEEVLEFVMKNCKE